MRLHLAAFAFGPNVGRRRELPLGQAVNAVVFDDVQHIHVAADGMAQVAEADGERIAVAGDTDVSEFAVGGVSSGGDGGHPSMRGIEAMSATREISRGLPANNRCRSASRSCEHQSRVPTKRA